MLNEKELKDLIAKQYPKSLPETPEQALEAIKRRMQEIIKEQEEKRGIVQTTPFPPNDYHQRVCPTCGRPSLFHPYKITCTS